MAKCYGCGADGEAPIVGVMHSDNVDKGTDTLKVPGQTKGFVGVPVCAECHRDPEHRTAHALKAHFFPAEHATVAVLRAGSANLGG